MSNVKVGTIQNAEYELSYFTFGKGEKPFVIIPGSSVKSIFLFRDGVEAQFSDYISHRYTAYVFEYRRPLPSGITARQMAEDIATAMKTLGITNAYIFGASLGGVIAQYIAINHPELVNKIAVCSSLARANETSRKVFENWLELSKPDSVATLLRDINDKIYSSEYKERFADFFASSENDATPEEIERFKIQIDACNNAETYNELQKIQCPVLAVGAKGDRVLTGEASREIATLTGGEYYLYDGYSHAVYDEAPDFRQMIFDFFKK